MNDARKALEKSIGMKEPVSGCCKAPIRTIAVAERRLIPYECTKCGKECVAFRSSTITELQTQQRLARKLLGE